MSDQPAVKLVDTTKIYGDFTAVDHVDLSIRRGELFTLLGPSGSGKTTILRMIAGLIRPTSGEIFINGADVKQTEVHERDIGLVFQSLALFPHMTVFGNLAFPLQMRRMGRTEIRKKVKEVLEVVRLPNLESRNINELSGGQQQRVALARALVYQPSLLLLDEPLGALDRRLREEMQIEIVRLHQEIDLTIINVTHDQREALMLSDRIGVMNRGRLEQVGSGHALYREPATRFVADFLGDANIFDGIATTDGRSAIVTTSNGTKIVVGVLSDALVGQSIAVAVRAECIRLGHPTDDLGCANQFQGSVFLRSFEGSAMYYEVKVPGLIDRLKVTVDALRGTTFERGDPVRIGWDETSAPLMPLKGLTE